MNHANFSLIEVIVAYCKSSDVFTDIIIEQGRPIKQRTPAGLVPISEFNVEESDITAVIGEMDDDWKHKIVKQAISKSIVLKGERVRINAYSFGGRSGYGLAVRRIPGEPIPFDRLGLPNSAAQLRLETRGLVLVIGATGSGKSMTIASMLDNINKTRAAHIITIEDPIEFMLTESKSTITSKEVGEDVSDFSTGVRDAMREVPDALLIGEVRDRATMETALYASESGCLVFASMHANTVEGALAKIVNFFPDESVARAQGLSTSLLGVISQALVPSRDGGQYQLACEVLLNRPEVADCIGKMDWRGIRTLISARGPGAKPVPEGCIPMNASLAKLVAEHRIEQITAQRVSLDTIDLTARINEFGRKAS